MKITALILTLCLSLPSAAQAPRAEFENQASTEEGLLVVHGGTQELRAAILSTAHELIESLLTMVGPAEGDPVPTILELHPPRPNQGTLIRTNLLFLPEAKKQYRLQVDLLLGVGGTYDHLDLRRTLLQMFLYERSLRSQTGKDSLEKVVIRPWLVEGLLEAKEWEQGRGKRDIYASLSRQGEWIPVEKLLEQVRIKTDDPLEAQVFRASSGALVMALLAQPSGKESLANYLTEVALFEGEPMALLSKHFPGINRGRNGLEKWWMLQMAAMAAPPMTETLTPQETEDLLAKMLTFQIKNEAGTPETIPFSEWETILALPLQAREEAIRPATTSLLGLSNRCYPSYRPVLVGYLDFLRKLVTAQPEKLPEMATNLQEFRDAEITRAERLRDLLDWYHLSTVRQESGKFEEYLELKSALEKPLSHKNDPVMEYVDRVEKIFNTIE